MPFILEHSYLIPLLPLIAAILCGTGVLGNKSHLPVWGAVGVSALLSFILLFGMIGDATPGLNIDGEKVATTVAFTDTWFTWFSAGTDAMKLTVSAGAFIDPLTAVMLCVVCGIGFLITVFAAGYMKGEIGYWRFFAYVALFITSMTLLVMGDNLVMLFLGWEGVGLCSYLLIGYYHDKPAARDAAKKAFIVNRIGDLGFLLGIYLCFQAFGTVSYFGTPEQPGLLELAGAANLTSFQQTALTWIPFLLMLGAFGKSAQFPLHVWLPDAMEGPTPVSALIHAATMVTAGVYMIARCGTLFVTNEAAMITIAVIGGVTALMGATIALRQWDLKKVFAYSTVSQLGFMFVGVAMLAPVAAVFHLVTHAFFKALLFLSSGVIMHAMLGHLDMRRMSGLKKQLPLTRIVCLIGCLALAGFPLTAGFFSKDEILVATKHHSIVLYVLMSFVAFLTAFYTFRVYFRVFEGPEVVPNEPAADHQGHDDHADHAHAHDEHHAHKHEPAIMLVPLIVLAIGALFAGALNLPGMHKLGDFLGASPSYQLAYQSAVAAYGADHVDAIHFGQPTAGHGSISYLPFIIAGCIGLAGIALAYVVHLKNRKPETVTEPSGFLENKWYIDELYDKTIVGAARLKSTIFDAIDKYVIDGIVTLVGFVPQLFALILRYTTQRGYLQGYALTMVMGAAILLVIVFLS